MAKSIIALAAINLPSLVSSFVSPLSGCTSNQPKRQQEFITSCNGNGIRTRMAASKPDKGELYGDDELMRLLSTHMELFPEDGEETNLNEVQNGNDFSEASAIPGIHDLVLQTLDDILIPPFEELGTILTSMEEQGDDDLQITLIRERKPAIRAIASDVDGTLLSSGQSLHPRTLQAVLNAIDQMMNGNNANDDQQRSIDFFFAATGKSRKGAADSLGPEIGPLLSQCPGVYLQGLYCVDGKGNVVFEKKLPSSAVRAAEDLVKEYGISIIGYDGDNLFTTEQTEIVVSLSEFYGEPKVELMLCENNLVLNLIEHGPGLHKLLLMDEDVEKLASVIRPKLEQLAKDHGATVTQAIPTMLELLPEGCSKAFGVEKVCEALGIDATTELLALGDAENDAGMLKMASIGVAVGNACPQAREAADYVMQERNDEGGAGLAIEIFGF